MTSSGRGGLNWLAAVCALSCGAGDIDLNPPGGGGAVTPVTFATDIHPILRMKCGKSGCHDMPNSLVLPGHGAADVGVAYAAATGVGSLGIPLYERILMRISSTDPSVIMPPTPDRGGDCEGALGAPGCVTQAEFDLIQEWIDQGRPR